MSKIQDRNGTILQVGDRVRQDRDRLGKSWIELCDDRDVFYGTIVQIVPAYGGGATRIAWGGGQPSPTIGDTGNLVQVSPSEAPPMSAHELEMLRVCHVPMEN